jgi:K+-transporting ATPase ATPase A chain
MMTRTDVLQIFLYLTVLLLTVKPLGVYMARVYEGKPLLLDKILGPFERFIYKICGIHAKQEMDWKIYTGAMLIFNFAGLVAVYALLSVQQFLPLNPQNFGPVPADLAFNTAASFITNTNWQAYAGESTLSYFSQMVALTVQNFLSAATGMSILVALIRGIKRKETTLIGNFWVDTLRGTLYILLPLSLVFSLVLVSQGVIQNFKAYETVQLVEETKPKEQTLPMGPVASQVAIKQLGTNGGGYFNANSAHPFENPTPLSNFLEMLAILLIPAALCYSFGVMVEDKQQGWAIFLAMFLILVPLICATTISERSGITAIAGSNMEGKETRLGIANSAVWAAAATATGNGSANTMYDSFTPLGGLVPLWLMQLGEVVFGGVGSGLYGMLILVIIAVFVGGLMIGRTPSYLGKKIEPFEMKMASIVVLLMPFIVLLSTAIAVLTEAGRSSIANPGSHGFTEILYAFSSMGNNNGSAFAGLNANTPFYNILGGMVMLIGRYVFAVPVLAIAGSLAQKKIIPSSAGTLSTDTSLFVGLLIGVVLILAALTFLPALALGPIVEDLMMRGY